MLDGESWVGRARWRGPGAKGELLVIDARTTYGMVTPAGGERAIEAGKSEYTLFAVGEREWSAPLAVRIRAMLLCGDTIFTAGVPDEAGEVNYWDALEGRKGGVLCAFSAEEGTKISEQKLDAAPVFDGMAATPGRLYLSAQDGTISCFGEK